MASGEFGSVQGKDLMTGEKETRPSRQARGREPQNNDMVSDPFAKCTWLHGAALIAAFAFTFAFITFSEIGVIS